MSTLSVTRITHSCHLLEIGGLTFLTDPWFTVRPGYYQGEPIALSIAELPRLDGVLISHEHYDHCDLDAFATYRDLDVPLVVPQTVVETALAHGFTDVRPLFPWEQTKIDGVTITAAPGKHGVDEITFVLRAEGDAIYFGGDTLLIPELREIPDRLGPITIALLPTNGLRIVPAGNMQVVMDAEEAAELNAVLKPQLALPHHYAFTKGWLGDRLITHGDKNPEHFRIAAARLAPDTVVRIVEPGTRVEF
ncbi:MBL fold metallo-hydrolase [Leifsonia sp. NPDC056665]|uniref:MBL fold metallo-hydrolase n=1 Tax=Leifsonia sp. NPDC056665 TaxID=3345901 RepID=UPI0036883D81